MMRKKISDSVFQDSEQSNDPAVNSVVLKRKTLRSPRRSPNQPTQGISTVRVIIKPVRTHWMRFNEVPKDDIIVGIAIFTAVTLKPTDKVPRNSVIAIDHLRNPAEFCSGLAGC